MSALAELVRRIYDGELLDGSFRDVVATAPAAPRDPELAERLARQLAADPERPLAELELVGEPDRARLRAFNATAFPASETATIDDLFRATVQRHPERRAVTFQGTSLTYAELDRRVDVLARRLVQAGAQPGEPIAIRLAPSLETIVALLGALRAGASYLPLDPDLPAERLRYVLDDSGARIVIDRETLVGDAPEIALPAVAAADPAYMIYTSGTTGNPKGVVIEHRSVVNYVSWFRDRYAIDASHAALVLTSYAFDLAYTTLWTTILSGGELHLVPKQTSDDVAAIARYIREHGITFLKLTPSLLGALLATRSFDRAHCGSLRLIVTGGERARAADIAEVYARLPGVRVVNHYGPTETTIGVTTHPIQRGEAVGAVIGRPIGNTVAYVATRDLKLVPIGAAGELLIGGRGVARGYHRRDALTREKFIADPFEHTGMLYRTGDLARWTTDGTLELLGRIDRQVKIRGYRVEPGEIEHVMLRLGISEVAVVERAGSLYAYYTGRERDRAALRVQLAELVPAYLVPADFVWLAALPRTANGKLDTARLPEPRAADPAPDRPSSETERVLVDLWSEILGIDRDALGVSQNFFELGGHSLLMIQVIAAIDDRFGRTVEIPAFYQEGTIRSLARMLDP